MINLWQQCKDRVTPQFISHELIRVVESQEQIASNSLVDNLEEQAALEFMLEDNKPSLLDACRNLDYLLATPFRYPPLKYGSRFGSRKKPSLFYGSHTLTTAFAETAYYRFLFWRGMTTTPPSGKFVTQHTVFGIKYSTKHGIKLQNHPFSDYENYLLNLSDYSATQILASELRDFGVNAIEYRSARDIDHGINVALFHPSALACIKPLYQEQWLCDTNGINVTFNSAAGNIYQFPIETFLLNGDLPNPAT